MAWKILASWRKRLNGHTVTNLNGYIWTVDVAKNVYLVTSCWPKSVQNPQDVLSLKSQCKVQLFFGGRWLHKLGDQFCGTTEYSCPIVLQVPAIGGPTTLSHRNGFRAIRESNLCVNGMILYRFVSRNICNLRSSPLNIAYDTPHSYECCNLSHLEPQKLLYTGGWGWVRWFVSRRRWRRGAKLADKRRFPTGMEAYPELRNTWGLLCLRSLDYDGP